MKPEITKEQINKLPIWAQNHISSLERQVETWRSSALRFAKEQPESPFFIKSYGGGPDQNINSPTRTICMRWAGIDAQIFLTRRDDAQRPFGIEITFEETNKTTFGGAVAVMPRGHGNIALVHKENMQ